MNKKLLMNITFFFGLISLIFVIGFLSNPFIFIKDIEKRITNSIENESGMKLNYLSFSGNFFKGFTIQSPSLYIDDKVIGETEIIKIYPKLITNYFNNQFSLSKLILTNGFLNLDDLILKQKSQNNSQYHIRLLELDNFSVLKDGKNFVLNSKLEIDISNKNKILFISGFYDLPFWPFQIEIFDGELKTSKSAYYAESIKINSNYGKIEISGEFSKEKLLNSFANIKIENLIPSYFFESQIKLDNLSIMFKTVNQDSSIARINGNGEYNGNKVNNYQLDLGVTEEYIHINSGIFSDKDKYIETGGFYDFVSENINLDLNFVNVHFMTDKQNMINGKIKLDGKLLSDSLRMELILKNSIIENYTINELQGVLQLKKNSIQNLNSIIANNDSLEVLINKFNFNTVDRSFQSTGELYFNNYIYKTNYNDQEYDLTIDGAFLGEIKKEQSVFSITGQTNLDRLQINDNYLKYFVSDFDYIDSLSDPSFSITGTSKIENSDYDTLIKIDSLYFSIDKNNEKIIISNLNGFLQNIPHVLLKDIEFSANKFTSKEIFLNYNEVDILTENILANKKDEFWDVSDQKLFLNESEIIFYTKFENFDNYEIDITSNNLNFSSVNSILELPQRILGQFSGQFNYIKYFDNYNIETKAKINDGEFYEMLFDSLKFDIISDGNQTVFNNIDYYHKNENFNISGNHDINRSQKNKFRYGDIELRGKASNFKLENLNNFIPISFDIGGISNGEIFVKGTPDSPIVDILLNVENPKFDLITGRTISGEIHYENEISLLQNIHLSTEHGSYSGSGYVPINLNLFGKKSNFMHKTDLNFNFSGETTQFEFLTPYFDVIDSINGNVKLNGNISGSLTKPIRNGQIEINEARLNLMPIKNTISNINGFATIKDNLLTIEKLSGLTNQIQEVNQIQKISSLIKSLLFKNNEEKNLIFVDGSMDLEDFFDPDFSINMVSDEIFIESINDSYKGSAEVEFDISGKDTILIQGEFKPLANKFTFLLEFDEENELLNEKINKGKVLSYDIEIPLDNGVKIENSQMDGY
ncbi:MAG: hypothetical protein VX770_09495, partial [Candidatus Neomarinimicrobiota bacterium]|nr:hypothetical protein [Candidatus Neomarinimicrobiota bacterium]